jgi:hypothetical protein
VNNVAISVGEQVYLLYVDLHSFGYMQRSAIEG